MAMATCVSASLIAASVSGIGGNGEGSKLHNDFGEGILQAYLMAAVEVSAGEDNLPALHAATSFSSRRVADVPREQEVVYLEAMPKILHGLQEIVLSETPAHYTGGIKDADFGIQKVTERVIEANTVNEISTELNENSMNHLELNAAIPSNETAEGSDNAGDGEASPITSVGAAEVRDIQGADGCMCANVIASQGVQDAKDSANVQATPNKLDVIQRLGCANDSDHIEEVSDVAKGPAVNLAQEAASVLQDSDTTEVNEIFMDEGDVRIRTSFTNGSESEAKAEVSSARTANMEAVDNVNSAPTLSRSFSFTGLNHIAFCVENLERSLEFYCGFLGLKTNMDRPELPYRGAWLFLGAEGIHIMEVPNPDPVNGRPAHGGFDRHACLNCKNVEGVRLALEKAGIPYQPSPVPSLFTRDPDGNGLEFIEIES